MQPRMGPSTEPSHLTTSTASVPGKRLRFSPSSVTSVLSAFRAPLTSHRHITRPSSSECESSFFPTTLSSATIGRLKLSSSPPASLTTRLSPFPSTPPAPKAAPPRTSLSPSSRTRPSPMATLSALATSPPRQTRLMSSRSTRGTFSLNVLLLNGHRAIFKAVSLSSRP